MAAISSLQIGGTTYDIYAQSAQAAPGSSHELSSHNHFSTYFNGTSANSALTSKSALSAGSANTAANAGTARNGNFYLNSLGIPTYNSASTYAVGAMVYTANSAFSASAAAPTATGWAAVSSKFTRLPVVTWSATDTSITGLYNGLTLWVRVPGYGGTATAAATNISINGSAAKQVRYNNANYTTHYAAGSVIHMVYDGTYFQVGDRDTNDNNKVNQYRTTANTAYPIILKWNNTTASGTNTVNFNESLTYNPNTQLLGITAQDEIGGWPVSSIIRPNYIKLYEGDGGSVIFDGFYLNAEDNGNTYNTDWGTLITNSKWITNNTTDNSAKTAQNAGTATNSKQVSSTPTSNNANYYLNFIDSTAAGYKKLYHGSSFYFNPKHNILTNNGSGAIINGSGNSLTVQNANCVTINGYTNTATKDTNTRPTSGVTIIGSNNKSIGLKNGAIIGSNITVSGSNDNPIQNAVFIGNYNSIGNLNTYKTAKVVVSEQRGNDAGTSARADIFAIKGGGSIWSNIFFRNGGASAYQISLNGFYDSKSNYATLANPVPSGNTAYAGAESYFNINYSPTETYLAATINGFFRPTDIRLKKVTDNSLSYTTGAGTNTGKVYNSTYAGLSLISLTAGDGTPGNIYIGNNSPGTAYLGYGAPGVLYVGYGDAATAYFSDGYGYTNIYLGGDGGSDLIIDDSLGGASFVYSKVGYTLLNYSIGSTKNAATKSAGTCYAEYGNSYANIKIANEIHYPYSTLSAAGNLPHSHVCITESGGADITIATAVFASTGSPKVTASVNIGNFSNTAGYDFTYVKVGGAISSVKSVILNNDGDKTEIQPYSITISESNYAGVKFDSMNISANDNGDTANTNWISLINNAKWVGNNTTGNSAKSSLSAGTATSALTSKSALSAGSAAQSYSSYWTSGSSDITRPIAFADATPQTAWTSNNNFSSEMVYDKSFTFNPSTHILSVSCVNVSGNTTNTVTAANATNINAIVNPKIKFSNTNSDQHGYIIWSDYNNTNVWSESDNDSAFFPGKPSDGFVVTSDQLRSVFYSDYCKFKHVEIKVPYGNGYLYSPGRNLSEYYTGDTNISVSSNNGSTAAQNLLATSGVLNFYFAKASTASQTLSCNFNDLISVAGTPVTFYMRQGCYNRIYLYNVPSITLWRSNTTATASYTNSTLVFKNSGTYTTAEFSVDSKQRVQLTYIKYNNSTPYLFAQFG